MVMTQSHKDAIKKGVQSYHACAKSHGCGKGNKATAKKPVKKEVKKVVKKPVEKAKEKDESYLKEQQEKLDKFIDESNNPKIKSFKGIGKSNQVFNVKLKDNDVTFTYRDKGTNKVKKVSFIFKVKEKAVAKPVKKAVKKSPSPEIFKDNIKSPPPKKKLTEKEIQKLEMDDLKRKQIFLAAAYKRQEQKRAEGFAKAKARAKAQKMKLHPEHPFAR